MAVYFLNISVDSIDPQSIFLPENLSVNDQESIIELVVEQILGFEKAFSEFDDNDSSEQIQKKGLKIDLNIPSQEQINGEVHFAKIHWINYHFIHQRDIPVYLKIDTPPPRV